MRPAIVAVVDAVEVALVDRGPLFRYQAMHGSLDVHDVHGVIATRRAGRPVMAARIARFRPANPSAAQAVRAVFTAIR